MRDYVSEVTGDLNFKKGSADPTADKNGDKFFSAALDCYMTSVMQSKEIHGECTNFEIYLKQGKCNEKLRDFDKATTCF